MIFKEAVTETELGLFFNFPKELYKKNPFYRSTDEEICSLLVKGPTVFHSHASIAPYLIYNDKKIAGRVCLIVDHKLPEFVQAAFFEAEPGLGDLAGDIMELAHKKFPVCKKIVFGLNGHLNYSAGLLMNKYDEPPLFGLPYTRDYREYFGALKNKRMFTFRYPLQGFFDYCKKNNSRFSDSRIKIKLLNKKNLKEEISRYTSLDNSSFGNGTPYWSDRLDAENYEIFHPFRYFINGENLIFAEVNGVPAGFLLWYPDFNQLVNSNNESLNLKHLLKYRLFNKIDSVRFTEIAVLPQFQKTMVTYMLISKMAEVTEKKGYKWVEGGFIFGDNKKSISMTIRYYERITGIKSSNYREFAIFEGELL